MTIELQTAVIAAGSALIGSIIGGVISYVTTMQSAKIAWRNNQIDKQITSLVTLHGNLLSESARVVLHAVDNNYNGAATFAELHTLLARIRLTSDEETIQVAEQLVRSASRMHVSKKEKDEEASRYSDLVKMFCVASKKELAKLRY